ncbi:MULTISPECIES: hypothetical protein [unclassified Massilia]|nr:MULTISPECIES: hypothetical protein [unclassified Massilia]
MKPVLRWGAIALACLVIGGCQGRQEPVKPITGCVLASFVDF